MAVLVSLKPAVRARRAPCHVVIGEDVLANLLTPWWFMTSPQGRPRQFSGCRAISAPSRVKLGIANSCRSHPRSRRTRANWAEFVTSLSGLAACAIDAAERLPQCHVWRAPPFLCGCSADVWPVATQSGRGGALGLPQPCPQARPWSSHTSRGDTVAPSITCELVCKCELGSSVDTCTGALSLTLAPGLVGGKHKDE